MAVDGSGNVYVADGVSDGMESSNGHNPLDPQDVPALPLAAWPMLLALLAVGVVRLRRSGKAFTR